MGTEVGILWEQGYPLASAFGPAMPPAALWRPPASGLGLVLLRSLGGVWEPPAGSAGSGLGWSARGRGQRGGWPSSQAGSSAGLDSPISVLQRAQGTRLLWPSKAENAAGVLVKRSGGGTKSCTEFRSWQGTARLALPSSQLRGCSTVPKSQPCPTAPGATVTGASCSELSTFPRNKLYKQT